jgi:SanA protein
MEKASKGGIPLRKTLIATALFITLAGAAMLSAGIHLVWETGFPLSNGLFTGLAAGLLLYFLIFTQSALLPPKRIFIAGRETAGRIHFFMIRGYLLMLLMAMGAILLHASATTGNELNGIFFLALAFPLLISSVRFWFYGFRYAAFCKIQAKQTAVSSKPLLRRLKTLRVMIAYGTTLCLMGMAVMNWVVASSARKYIYQDLDALPYNKVGLVPGTSSKLASGQTNLYFIYRLQAAAALYENGKIDYIIVSGDNRTVNYNEPLLMKKELLRLGVPDSVIIADYAGRRTFDSVIRAYKIFGQKKFTFISQQFQNERAIFLARRNDIEAIAFDAKDVGPYTGFKTKVRELFARVKIFVDEYILKTQPAILGNPEPI